MPGPERLTSLDDVRRLGIAPGRRLFSAEHAEILAGHTTDIYFIRTRELLDHLGLAGTPVVADVFASRGGVFCGSVEAVSLLHDLPVTVWALPEGSDMTAGEVVMRIEGPYEAFGLYETAILGILASSSAWATAARDCRDAAQGRPFISFGSRHIHPAVAPVMERAAVVGGAAGASNVLAAKLLGQEPLGTIPHACILVAGDTVRVAEVYDRSMPPDAPRIILVDTFKDEAEESLRVAEALGKRLEGVRLDTPAERGGVTPALVREVRARLDQAGFGHVKIFVSGGVNPTRIPELVDAGADAFGIGSYITSAPPIDMTLDLKAVDGRPIAKRGRIPGAAPAPRLERALDGGR